MPHATPVVQDLEKSKTIARAIQKRFDELDTAIKLNHAYEALAIAHRHPNWATMKAALDARDSAPATSGMGVFVLGQRAIRCEDSVPEDIELPHEDSLKRDAAAFFKNCGIMEQVPQGSAVGWAPSLATVMVHAMARTCKIRAPPRHADF
jgi:hypothetical protein